MAERMPESDPSLASPAPAIRPDVRALLDLMAASGAPSMSDVTPPHARAMFHKLCQMTDAPAVPLAVIRDFSGPGPASAIALRYYDRRADRTQSPVILFMHGGGFVIGDLETHHSFCTTLADELDLPLVAVDYRLAPEHPFPAAPEDCIAIARWLATSPDTLPFAVTGLVPCGDSAGGNLATVVSLALTTKPAAVPLVAQLAIYPAVDSAPHYTSLKEFAEGYFLDTETMRWFRRQYAAPADPLLSDTILANAAGLPPTLVVTASLDPLRDQGLAYLDRLTAAGVAIRHYEAVGNIHGFITMRGAVASGADDVARIIDAATLVISEGMR